MDKPKRYDIPENSAVATAAEEFENDGLCSHACRQISNNLWTSKMGPLNDIQHSSPQTLEGDFYGRVYCYMKRPNGDRK